ncbi:MAG: VCBS repeat-containing protein, partial [Tolypothrix sp. T3-bin4]|nr:VCBS repeat-containing protein [Tolypothrix sp. T3-bin4]
SNYQAFSLHTGTALEMTGDNFDFQVGDYDGDGLMDIAAIKKSDTPKGMTELHILNGATNFQTFSLHTETALHQTPSGWDFVMDDYNANNSMGVIGLKGNPPTGTNTTEAHILNEDTTYQSWVMQTGTVLHNIAPSSVV